MARRAAMRIAEMPLENREAAFASAKNSLHEAFKEKGLAGDQLDGFVELQMQAIRKHVTDINIGGSSKGGRA
jgi:hypothetical protein